MKNKLIIIVCTLSLFGCQPKESESESLKEAKATYSRMMQIAQDSKAIAETQIDQLKLKADSLILIGDSLLANKLIKVNTKLDSLHLELETWKKQAQEMKAHSSLAEGDEPHDHSHHGKTIDYSEFSDEQLLELQIEMEKQVQLIQNQLSELKKSLTEDVD